MRLKPLTYFAILLSACLGSAAYSQTVGDAINYENQQLIANQNRALQQTGGNGAASLPNSPMGSTPLPTPVNGNGAASGTKQPAASLNEPVRRKAEVVAIYGVGNNLQVVIRDKGHDQAYKVGEVFNGYRIASISTKGVSLEKMKPPKKKMVKNSTPTKFMPLVEG